MGQADSANKRPSDPGKTARGDPNAARTQALAAELRVLTGKLKRRLQEQTHYGDLTLSQTSVIGRLDQEGPATISMLARREGMRPQSMGAIVGALEAAGHVDGAPDPEDGRQTLWSLTESCREWLLAGRAAREDWLAHAIEQTIPPAERDALARGLALINRIVEAK
jgi:DNA-binding MarR family transcriptional regulator